MKRYRVGKMIFEGIRLGSLVFAVIVWFPSDDDYVYSFLEKILISICGLVAAFLASYAQDRCVRKIKEHEAQEIARWWREPDAM